MAGSIRPRPEKGRNVYELRIFVGRDARGRVRQKSKIFRGTRRAAEMELARLVTENVDEPVVIPQESASAFGPSTTINMAIKAWQDNGWQDLSPSTTLRYASIWTTHIKDSIGRRQIATLGPYDVELYLRRLKSEGLSESSVRQTRAILHRACRLARKWSGNALPNPVSGTEMPDWMLHEQPDAVRAPTLSEVRSLLAASREFGARVHGFVAVVASTGMRRGEACALRWSDIDFERSTVTVDESIVAADGGAQIKAPKSRAGIRTVALDQVTLSSLLALRRGTDELAVLGGFVVEPSHFVFATELPGVLPPHPDTMSHSFSRIRKEAGVSADVHLHSLRHFQATVLDSVISEAQKQSRLGWSTVHMARHYTDGVEEEDRRAAEHLGALFAAEGEGAPQVGHTPAPGVKKRSRLAGSGSGSEPSIRRSTARRGTRRRPLS
jgi:integrase